MIKRAILFNKALLLETITPKLGFKIAKKEELIVEAQPIGSSLLINNVFFFLNCYTSPYNIHFQFQEISKLFNNDAFQCYLLLL